jgi:hypothetical protein
MPYKVEFPSGETRDFENVVALCEGLNISRFTVNTILNGTCKFNHKHTKPLKDMKLISSFKKKEDEV